MPIDCQRALFDIPDSIAYFNCAYMAPQLKSVTEAGIAAVSRKARPWEIGVDDFFADAATLKEQIAELLSAAPADIALTPSVSYGLSTAAANLRLGAGERILVLDGQFPSNVYPWRELARIVGASVVTVERPESGDWTEALLVAIGDTAACVAIPNVHWTDGALIDLETVSARCREIGAALVIDATQSLGAMPLSVKTVQPDFVAGALYKWLLGPYSLGFLYASPAHQDGRPLEYNWMTRKGSEDFAGLVRYRDEYQPGAARYDVGERSNFALLPMAIEALRQIERWGVAEIEASLNLVTGQIAERAGELGLTVAPASQRCSHFLGLTFPDGVPEPLLTMLREAEVYVSVRGDSIRVAPHLYNSAEDVARLFAVLENAL
ncbi:MAG: aminotransferase class V-fold PLP-dependent enzyme [Pseudomonadota bacterium]